MNLDTPISALNKVGKTTSGKLKRLNIFNTGDLLNYFPFRYEDYSKVYEIKELREGDTVTIKGKIELIANRRTRSRKILTESLVSDPSGSIRMIWFNQPFLLKNLLPGKTYYFSGSVKRDMLGSQLVSPAYESVEKRNLNTGRLVPIYPLTEGLTQKQIRFLVEQIIPLTKEVPDWVPQEILAEQKMIGLSDAIRNIHFPENFDILKRSEERLKFNELLLIQLQAEQARLQNISTEAPAIFFKENEIKEFVNNLPFTLTKSQKISTWEILQNIGVSTPMNRLLSGDVGSGKTIVAATALLNTVLNGYQGIIMAPTEILAAQHYNSFIKLLPKLSIALFTRSHKTLFRNGIIEEITKAKLIKEIETGKVQVILGTHALLSEKVEFKKIGLVVVDEQHRFGVMQRKIIKEKGRGAHFLSMTATPIPRSLALMLYGDLDISIINELPANRKQIKTRLVLAHEREKAYEFIRTEIKKGRQVFVVCPLIEDSSSESIEKKSVLAEYKKLSEKIFPEFKVAYLHGKMKGEEKDEIMEKFKNKQTDVLVSTSVIEVGVDVPNATVMMIEGADRFGLAQLHQFRGRVGRGEHQSFCLVFSDNSNQKTLDRLKYFESHLDGFSLAEKDLEIRGPGEVYGTTQSGMMQLRLAKLTDRELIKKAREVAKQITPRLSNYPLLLLKLEELNKTLHLE